MSLWRKVRCTIAGDAPESANAVTRPCLNACKPARCVGRPNTESWMAAGSKAEYGDPSTQLDLLRLLSPIYKIDQLKAPVIVLHGDYETNVPIEEAEQVGKYLQVPMKSVTTHP